ncbi:MAG: 2-oxo acid dehydrogenase subunit E2 [Myxococcales bacterium]|nr:MAG: 2-oxo acid dehydrogenase subunit E2 [Myxococcales bacterium]
MTVLNMPQLGESVFEGTIGKWLVSEGDFVEKDQALVEVLTDKADSELPAPASGVVVKINAQEGDTVAVGDALCEIDENAKGNGAKPAEKDRKETPPPPSKEQSSSASSAQAKAKTTSSSISDGPVSASPAVRKAAREEGIDLSSVQNKDAAERAKALSGQGAGSGGLYIPEFKLPPYIERPGDEIIKFSRRRRIIADHMLYSKHVAPQVVTFAEVDMHATTKLRTEHKGKLKSEGINLTFLAFVTAATARALSENRALNSRVLDDAYVILRDINLGIAVDTPEGLVVPVIKNADTLSIRGLAKAIDELAEKSRDGKLAPDDLAGKTFTISNPGRKGNLVGGAIISQPNVGILRIGEIKKRVVVVEKDGEDFMAIHPVMQMALTYDHRVVDGVAANGFLHRIHEILEQADFEL